MTIADIIDSSTGDQLTSNVFYYTFSAPDEILEILPRSYHETMWCQKFGEHLLKYEPNITDLAPRSMQDSFTSVIIPLSSDKSLQDQYVAFLGHVRLGRLMEDMDMFAVWVCHQHVHVPSLPADVHLPYTFVTILVDKVTFSDVQTRATEDIRMSGHVSWVGRSSMEIFVWLEQKENGSWRKITRALFLMTARNATNTGAAPVNPI
uniref:HotDog ACOT-type domain-containing protein n=1 Tax=Glossina palpalis gambiensis TaxID=67801 RepID=A0A1B0C318_9MUSC